MKNIAHKLEELEELPLFESGKQYSVRRYNHMRFSSRYRGSDLWKKHYDFTENLLIWNVGRSYDKTFKKFRDEVGPGFNGIFLDYFLCKHNWDNSSEYIIDENGMIQDNPEYREITVRNPKVCFRSFDYDYHWYNKKYDIIRKYVPYNGFNKGTKWVFVVLSGFKRYFNSKDSHEYKTLVKQDVQLAKKAESKKKAERDRKCSEVLLVHNHIKRELKCRLLSQETSALVKQPYARCWSLEDSQHTMRMRKLKSLHTNQRLRRDSLKRLEIARSVKEFIIRNTSAQSYSDIPKKWRN